MRPDPAKKTAKTQKTPVAFQRLSIRENDDGNPEHCNKGTALPRLPGFHPSWSSFPGYCTISKKNYF
jgi:hypothetical protein